MNRSLESIRQPVVERNNFVFDVATLPGGGLAASEQRRLLGWLEALDLGYGDRISLDDPLDSDQTRSSVEGVAGRFGVLLADMALVTEGAITPGTARVIVMRTEASVPGCPDWSQKIDNKTNNATSPGYGCAVNGNMAAMVAEQGRSGSRCPGHRHDGHHEQQQGHSGVPRDAGNGRWGSEGRFQPVRG